MKKVINFDDEMIKAIQLYANKHHNGNFTSAVRELTRQALNHINNTE